MTQTATDPFSIDERRCPDCQDIISTDIILDGKIETCADHESFEGLQECYRWLKGENKRLLGLFKEYAKGTLVEKLMADLKEAHESRGKWASAWYALYKKNTELQSRLRYKEAHIEELELENKLLKDSEKRTIENLKEIMAIQGRIKGLEIAQIQSGEERVGEGE